MPSRQLTSGSNDNPSDSDVDRRHADNLLQQEAVIQQFVSPDDLSPVWNDERFVPLTIVTNYAAANHVSDSMATFRMRTSLKAMCTDQVTKLGSVALDLHGVGVRVVNGQRQHRLWGIPDVPQIRFAAFRTTQPSFVAGECEAAAVYYLPPALTRDAARPPRTRIDQVTGEEFEVCDDFYVGGFIGVVRTYPSAEAAVEHMAQLSAAVRFIATPADGTAYTSDPTQRAGVRQDSSLPPAL